MIMSLCDFLNGNKTKAVIGKLWDTTYLHFVKINSGIDNIKLIYETESPSENIINLFGNLKFMGMYDDNTNIFYSSFFFDYRERDISNINVIKLEDLKAELRGKVQKEIINRIGYNENVLKIDKDNIRNISEEEAKETANKLFMTNSNINKYNYVESFTLPDLKYSEALFLLYLKDPEDIINTLAEGYIQKRSSCIFECIKKNKLVEKELEKLNEDKKAFEYRDIFSILRNKDMKTVNIEFLKENKIHKCKIENGLYYGNFKTYINLYKIVGSKDREKIEDLLSTDKETFRWGIPFDKMSHAHS